MTTAGTSFVETDLSKVTCETISGCATKKNYSGFPAYLNMVLSCYECSSNDVYLQIMNNNSYNPSNGP